MKWKKGRAFSLFHLADLSPWQPNKFSIFGNEQKKKKTNRRKKKFSTSFLLFLSFFFFSTTHAGLVSSVIMLAAVEKGDAKKLAELIRQDPGFDVNMDQNGSGRTLLHYACQGSSRSAVIPLLLLAHPDIDVNVRSNGRTPL